MICSYFLVLVSILAAAFWMSCSLSNGLLWKAGEETITIIHPAGDKGMNKILQILTGNKTFNSCNVFEMIVYWFSYCFDMTTKTKVCLQNHPKMFDLIFCYLTPSVNVLHSPWDLHLCFQMQLLFSLFNWRKFWHIQLLISSMHWQREWGYSHLEIRLGKSGNHKHSCDRQFFSLIIWLSGSIYRLNKSSARTEPWGTPHVMDLHWDLCFPILT